METLELLSVGIFKDEGEKKIFATEVKRIQDESSFQINPQWHFREFEKSTCKLALIVLESSLVKLENQKGRCVVLNCCLSSRPGTIDGDPDYCHFHLYSF